MKLPLQRHDRPSHSRPGVHGTARVDRRTRSLLPRLQPGDIAVLDHLDMDRATAQALVDAGVKAVVNASSFVSGRYPTQGPVVLLDAGILLVDDVGPDALGAIPDGQDLGIDGAALIVGGEQLAAGRVVDRDVLSTQLESARGGLGTQLENFTHNSTEFLRREQDLLLHGRGIPRVATKIEGRPVVVVVAGPDHVAELQAVKDYVREQHPVLIAVDAGADALRAIRRKPDIVVLSSPHARDEVTQATAKALRSARDVVVVVDRGTGKAPLESVERLGVRPLRLETASTAEDAALILASQAGASLIVGVGVHASLDDFLDRQRAGLASTFLARLKVGPELVDARAVPQLYTGRVHLWHLLLALLAGLFAVIAAVGVTPVGREWFDDLQPWLKDLSEGILS